ncbi:uncharacterized protein DC041_0003685 [Schistosoma bovis]|uniref:Uncharacterized protein n=1 Tax=Schistosoma bovis TaxID=6184 RepID=A0A430QCI0_SCHBO|nr:uncharacterized protein DC041_0003685 [Schistosoma bovis]
MVLRNLIVIVLEQLPYVICIYIGLYMLSSEVRSLISCISVSIQKQSR